MIRNILEQQYKLGSGFLDGWQSGINCRVAMTIGQLASTTLTIVAAAAALASGLHVLPPEEVVVPQDAKSSKQLVELHSPPEVEDALSFEYMEVK